MGSKQRETAPEVSYRDGVATVVVPMFDVDFSAGGPTRYVALLSRACNGIGGVEICLECGDCREDPRGITRTLLVLDVACSSKAPIVVSVRGEEGVAKRTALMLYSSLTCRDFYLAGQNRFDEQHTLA